MIGHSPTWSNHSDWEFPNVVSLKITLTIGTEGNTTCRRSSSSQVSRTCTQNKSQTRIVIPPLFARESSHCPLAPFLKQDPLPMSPSASPALPCIRISHYTSQTQGHLLLQVFLLGSGSSHANSCKTQDVFSPSLSKKLMSCMNWKPVQPQDTCMIFW